MSRIPRSDAGLMKAITMLFGEPRGVNDPLIFIRRQKIKLPTNWRSAMHAQLFTPVSVPLGDARVRGQQIECGRCGSKGQVPINSMQGSMGDDDRQSDFLAMRKFSRMGWVIGKTPSRHRCPTCQSATKPFAEALTPLVANNNNHHHQAKTEDKMSMVKSVAASGLNGASKTTLAVAAPEAREMSREDRRVIFAKLQDVYEVKTGYTADWSDKRVAEDMGVPRAWISSVRDEFFGPDHNEQFEQQITMARSVLKDIGELVRLQAAIQHEQQKLSERLTPLMALAERTEKTIAQIAKKTQP